MRQQVRAQLAKPRLDELATWLDQQLQRVAAYSAISAAVCLTPEPSELELLWLRFRWRDRGEVLHHHTHMRAQWSRARGIFAGSARMYRRVPDQSDQRALAVELCCSEALGRREEAIADFLQLASCSMVNR